jgi:AraC-like DNA-binding protein
VPERCEIGIPNAEPAHAPTAKTAALGTARPSLYRLLQDEGLQVNAHVADYRLNAIARTLRDPAWAAASVGDIGALWGHFDQAYLTRVFKKRFGETPSRYRSHSAAETARAYR